MRKGKIFYGWWIVIGSVLITSTMVPPVMSLANKFLLQVTEEMNISRSTFTFNTTIVQSLGIFLSPWITKNLVRGNMKKIQAISIIGFCLSYGSYSFAQKPLHLYLSSFVLGLCYLNATLIPISMMITNWFVKKRGLAMSLAMTGIGVGGFVLSPLITKWLMTYGWRKTYLIVAVLVLIIALPIALFVFKKKPSDIGLEPYGANEKIENQTSNNQTIKLDTKTSMTKLFFILLLVGMICDGIINSGSVGQFPPAIEELHGPTVQATIISLYSIIGIAGKLLLGWVNDRWGIVASTVFGCGAFSLAFICMLFGENQWAIYLMPVIFGLGMGIGTVSPPLVTSAIYGAEQYGEVYGVVNSATQIGLSLGSLLVANIFDKTGSYRIAWILLFALTIVTMFSWVFAYKSSRKYC